MWEGSSQVGRIFPLPIGKIRCCALDRRGTDLANWRSGHTLVELAVAIAVVGVLAAMGWWSVQDEVDRFRMMKAARLLQSDLQALRALAIASNRETRIVFTAADAALDPNADQVGAWLLQAGNT
ncbi:MAG: Tfp pilus assembly protein FimT/FimU, partial [Myxococcota bacterium]